MTATHTIPNQKARLIAIRRWRRRSRVVAFWRTILPVAIFAVVMSLAGWIVARSLLAGPPPSAEAGAGEQMTNPRYYGFDENNRSYLLRAAEAIRGGDGEGQVRLIEPVFNLGAGRVTALEGIYDPESTDIILRGDVVVIGSDGDRMETNEARIDTRTGEVTNMESPQGGRIQIENDMGEISADQYQIDENGQLHFRGRVRGVINAE
jgi:lipopolysaccharide export system protein LptC